MRKRAHYGAGGVFIENKKTRQRIEMHLCRVPGCDCRIRTSLLMCPEHWHQVPENLQAEVTEAWQEYKYWPGNGSVVQRYNEARRAAVNAVRERQEAAKSQTIEQ